MSEMPGPREALNQSGEQWPTPVWFNFWKGLLDRGVGVGDYLNSATPEAREGYILAQGQSLEVERFPDLFRVLGSVESAPGMFTIPSRVQGTADGYWLLRASP